MSEFHVYGFDLYLFTDYVKKRNARRKIQKYILLSSTYSNQQMHENRYRLAENPRKVFANRKAASRQFSFRSKRRLENSVTQSKTKGERISFTFVPNVVA